MSNPFSFGKKLSQKVVLSGRFPKDWTDEQCKAQFLKDLVVTQKEVDEIANIVQHLPSVNGATPLANPVWLGHRKGRLTGSTFGAAAGHNKYKSPKGLLKDLLWRTFKGNRATRWGTDHEPVACDAYMQFKKKQLAPQLRAALRKEYAGIFVDNIVSMLLDVYAGEDIFHVDFPGLMVVKDHPWVGTSPDGIVYELGVKGLLEIKCPFRKTLYGKIPPYYFDQIQGIMGFQRLPWCDFAVWTPDELEVVRYPFDKEYFEGTLRPALETFYMKEYLPRLIKKERGLLKFGEINEVVELDIDIGTKKRKRKPVQMKLPFSFAKAKKKANPVSVSSLPFSFTK